MNLSVCPYLGTLDHEERPAPAVEYPSLENQCFAAAADELLLLADQATFCLSSGHRHCPRYQFAEQTAAPDEATAADQAEPPRDLPPLDPEPASIGLLNTMLAEGPSNRRWAWAGAALLFLIVLLCGGTVAAYTGWQLVSARYLAAAPPGQVQTLSEAPVQQPQYLVVTATSAAPSPPSPTALAAEPLSPTVQLVFPPAVTPTPVVIDPNALAQPPAENGALANPGVAPVANTGAPVEQSEPLSEPQNVVLPTPELNLQMEIPTRRPTPVFEVPTSTPEPVEPTVTPTPTPTPILGTPVVQFGPLQYSLQEGQCTLLRWHVENVQAVYYENQPVNGDGQKEECMDDEPEVYTLAVILPDGQTSIYTATVDYLPPTPTLTPTPSFTPVRDDEPTPTWTPDVPTETPTPPAIYSLNLEVFGDRRRICTPGSSCEFDLLVTNLGNATDRLTLTFVQTGPWPALLCADGGDCGSGSVSVSNVSPGGGKLVKVKVSVSSDATPQTVEYAVQAVSNGSGGSVTSPTQGVEVEVQ
jgi:hypothetical protein